MSGSGVVLHRERLPAQLKPIAERHALPAAAVVLLIAALMGSLPLLLLAVGTLAVLVLTWRRTIVLFAGIVLLVPIHLYTLPGNLPFEAKLDRVVLIPALAFWLLALLASPRVKIRATPLGAPIGLFVLVMGSSLILNGAELSALGVFGDTLKKNLYFLGFFVAFFVTASVLQPRDVPRVIRFIVFCGFLVALGTFWARFTGFNIFRSEHQYFPFLKQATATLDVTYTRQGNGPARMVGSSEHPISFAVLMLMLLPMAGYLAREAATRNTRILWSSAAILMLGAGLLSGTRTSIVAMLLMFIAAIAMHPRDAPRLLALGLVGLMATWAVAPDTIGSVRAAVFPSNAEAQKTNVQGRTEDYGPIFDEFARSPIVGQGYGSFTPARFFFVDNAWLKLLPDVGAMGLLALLWLCMRGVSVLWRTARSRAPGAEASGALAIGAVVFIGTALLYDALDFTQVTYLFMVMLALGCVLDRERHELVLAGKIPGCKAERSVLTGS